MILSQRKYILLVIALFAWQLSFSQKLTFCESVDSSGNAKNEGTSFTIHKNGGFFNMLVTAPHGINSMFITYDIFKTDSAGKEIFESTIKQIIQPDFTWFSKEISFYKAGIYNVYVYDDRDRLLCVGKLTIKTEK